MDTNTTQQTASKGTLLKAFRDSGCFVKVWKNEGPKGPYVSLSTGRTYVDPVTNQYRDTHTYSRTQGLKMQHILQAALEEAKAWDDQFVKQRGANAAGETDGVEIQPYNHQPG